MPPSAGHHCSATHATRRLLIEQHVLQSAQQLILLSASSVVPCACRSSRPIFPTQSSSFCSSWQPNLMSRKAGSCSLALARLILVMRHALPGLLPSPLVDASPAHMVSRQLHADGWIQERTVKREVGIMHFCRTCGYCNHSSIPPASCLYQL